MQRFKYLSFYFLIILTSLLTTKMLLGLPNEKIFDHGSLVAYDSTQNHIYYALPQAWSVQSEKDRRMNNIWLEKKAENRNLLKFILKSDYSKSKFWSDNFKFHNQDSEFYKMKYKSQNFRILFLDRDFPLQATLIPSENDLMQETILVQMELDDQQLQIMKQLSQSGITLLGHHELSINTTNGESILEIPILVKIPPTIFDAYHDETSEPSISELILKNLSQLKVSNGSLERLGGLREIFLPMPSGRGKLSSTINLYALQDCQIKPDPSNPNKIIISANKFDETTSNLKLSITYRIQTPDGRSSGGNSFEVYGNFHIQMNLNTRDVSTTIRKINKVTTQGLDVTRFYPNIINFLQSDMWKQNFSDKFQKSLYKELEYEIFN